MTVTAQLQLALPAGTSDDAARGVRTATPRRKRRVDAKPVLRPDDPDGVLSEAVCDVMWPGFIQWAWSDARVRKDFTAATGIAIVERRSAIEVLVDKVTGYRASVIAKFVEWATVEIYGIEAAPRAVRDAIAAGTFGAEAAKAERPEEPEASRHDKGRRRRRQKGRR